MAQVPQRDWSVILNIFVNFIILLSRSANTNYYVSGFCWVVHGTTALLAISHHGKFADVTE